MDSFIQMSAHISKSASVCSDQPAASKVGLDILKMGGNAADAAIATFAVVSMIEPYMSGIGGDMQCLFYNKSDKKVLQLNGSGRTGKHTSLEKVKKSGIKAYEDTKYNQEGFWVSIPGAVAGIFHLLQNFGSGRFTMADLLQPAIQLAEEGVIIPRKASTFWKKYSPVFRSSRNSQTLLVDNRPPKAGEILTFPELATSFKEIASTGTKGFYEGPIAHKIVEKTTNASGSLTLEDFKEFERNPPSLTTSEAISANFYKFRIWEMRPNTIGIVALVMFKVLEKFDLKSMKHNSADYIHVLVEVTKLSYLECWDYLCDPDYCSGNIDDLLSDSTANKLKNQIDLNRASKSTKLVDGGNTSYLAVVDSEGNGCSFIASVSAPFGSGLIPDDCGFVLNNRLKCMSLEEDSPNAYGPSKLSLQTIIPALVTDCENGDLLAVFGVMGRWMQPQGHVQVLLNMIIFGMDPQQALNQPRFFVGKVVTFAEYKDDFSEVLLEGGIDPEVLTVLENKGHRCKILKDQDRDAFGRGHIIARPNLFSNCSKSESMNCWWSGTDPRTDSYPAGF